MSTKRDLPTITPIDLRPVTRGPARATIYVLDDEEIRREWIDCGALSIWTSGKVTEIGARMLKATDFEHDSAWAFRFRAIGLVWDGSVHNGCASFTGYIHPTALDELRVPSASITEWYEALDQCDDEHCQENRHRIVPEGYYAGPPPSPANKWLLGRQIEIRIWAGAAEAER